MTISKPISRDRLREVLRGLGRITRPEHDENVVGAVAPRAEPDDSLLPSYDREIFIERTEWDVELIHSLVAVFEADR